MKNRIFIVAAILGLLATACKKENPQNDLAVTPITISASYGVNDDAKVNYTESGNDITATWDAGDQLYVVYNGHLNTLTLSSGAGTTTATFTGTVVGTPTAMSVLICYVRDTKNPSAVEVSATGEYTYTSGVFLAQDGTLASAAKCNLFYGTTTYGNGSNISCTFTPNTSMMKFTVIAPDGVSAGDAATLTYKSGTTELAKAIFTVGANGRNTIYLTVPAGEYTGVQTLVYQSGEANVTETLSDTQACFAAGQTYSEIFSFGNPIIPEGAIGGKFTINSSGDQVYFSQGNLQATTTDLGENWSWAFATNQWDYVGNAVANNSINGNGTVSANGTVDLFGWVGASSNWTGAAQYGISNSGNTGSYDGYGMWTEALKSDWGNTIGSGWRTLTSDEWDYLINSRSSGSTVNGTSDARYTHATINTDGTGVNGLILFPDGVNISGGEATSWGNVNGSSNWGTKCTTAQWTALAAKGCVFLPAAGMRYGISFSDVHIKGNYWSSSSSAPERANVLIFLASQLRWEGYYRYYGSSVRLVRNVE